jgi:class 3 adenylate cyclase/tetratricopeptide (TPR) repeat protein
MDADARASSTLPTQPPAAPVAERRVTSVLFGDLVGFTTLSEGRDPEDVRELLSRYFVTARTVVERYGGTVEKFIGDAVMAVWGVPTTHEDDAERAVRAGLDLVDAVAELGTEANLPGLAMRVGVVTGEVAVTIGATGEGMVAGDAVNTASRVQTAATVGKVWVDEQTRGLTAAAVSYDDRGEHALKGKAEPVQLFEARHVMATVGGARRVDGLEAPFSGRHRELRLVKELMHAAFEESRPRLVAVMGAPGVGKTRLGWELDKYTDGINTVVMMHRGRCLSYGDGVAFWALAEIVRGRLRILEGDSNDVVVERLRSGVDEYVSNAEDRAWLLPRLATLLGVADVVAPGTSFARDDLFSAWRTFLEEVARAGEAVGAVLMIDDLQWADPGFLQFIDYVLDTAKAPIFILALARSELTERVPTFGSGRRVTTLYLDALPDATMATLVDGLVEGLPESVRDSLVARAEGLPLFAVETVRTLIDRDIVVPREGRYVFAQDAEGIDLDDESLPTSLHTLIASRLDGLPAEERRLVQDAAVLGQSFTVGGLSALVTAVGDDPDTADRLANLVRKEIFAVESDPRSPEYGYYRFVQAMVRTVAYDTLSRRDRKLRHLAAAAHLASEPDADTVPAVIASHYLDARASSSPDDDDTDQLASLAVDLLERAANRARGLGAPAETRRHLDTALSLVTAPTTVGRLTEAAARATLASGLPSEAVSMAEQARAIYAAAGLELEAGRALALWGEAQIIAGQGHTVVEPLTASYHELAERSEAAEVAAVLALGVGRAHYLSVGESEKAIPWFDRAVILGEALEDLPFLATTLSSYGGALILVGRTHMGLGLLRVSLELAQKLDDPTATLRPLNNLGSFLATRDLQAAREYAEASVAVATRLGDREWISYVHSTAIHVYWNAGEWDAAIQAADQTEALAEATASRGLAYNYLNAIRRARGLPETQLALSGALTGQHGDLAIEMVRAALAASAARGEGDLDAAADASRTALAHVRVVSGIDDDFTVFWVAAIDDQLAAGNVDMAAEVLAEITDAPRGHVATLLRGLLPWMRARIAIARGSADDLEADFTLAADALRRFGAPFYLARTLVDHAEWLDSRGKVAEAMPIAAEAAQLLMQLRATPWLERAQRLAGAMSGSADLVSSTNADG